MIPSAAPSTSNYARDTIGGTRGRVKAAANRVAIYMARCCFFSFCWTSSQAP